MWSTVIRSLWFNLLEQSAVVTEVNVILSWTFLSETKNHFVRASVCMSARGVRFAKMTSVRFSVPFCKKTAVFVRFWFYKINHGFRFLNLEVGSVLFGF